MWIECSRQGLLSIVTLGDRLIEYNAPQARASERRALVDAAMQYRRHGSAGNEALALENVDAFIGTTARGRTVIAAARHKTDRPEWRNCEATITRS
jgi:hypothetical protein